LPPDVIFDFGWVSTPDPTLEELGALPDPLARFNGSYLQGKGGTTGVRRRGKGFLFIFKHSWALKRSWKISHGGPGKSWNSTSWIFVSKRVVTLF